MQAAFAKLTTVTYEVLSIGNTKRAFIKEGCLFYEKRLRNHSSLNLKEIKTVKHNNAQEQKKQESEKLLKESKGYTIALDEKGKSFNSTALAKHVTKLELRGVSHLCFLIGGAEGHSEQLKASVNELWRLSDLTLPHELAKLMLLEQLYRIESIRAGHPYHRE